MLPALPMFIMFTLAHAATEYPECRIPGVPPQAHYGRLDSYLKAYGFTAISDMRPDCTDSKAASGCYFRWKSPAGVAFRVFVPFDGWPKPWIVADHPCPFDASRPPRATK
jgi:hypothetical protein